MNSTYDDGARCRVAAREQDQLSTILSTLKKSKPIWLDDGRVVISPEAFAAYRYIYGCISLEKINHKIFENLQHRKTEIDSKNAEMRTIETKLLRENRAKVKENAQLQATCKTLQNTIAKLKHELAQYKYSWSPDE